MDKKSYAFGMSLAGNLLQNGVHGLNFDDFVAGLKAMLQGEELAISMEEAGEALEQFYKEMEGDYVRYRLTATPVYEDNHMVFVNVFTPGEVSIRGTKIWMDDAEAHDNSREITNPKAGMLPGKNDRFFIFGVTQEGVATILVDEEGKLQPKAVGIGTHPDDQLCLMPRRHVSG